MGRPPGAKNRPKPRAKFKSDAPMPGTGSASIDQVLAEGAAAIEAEAPLETPQDLESQSAPDAQMQVQEPKEQIAVHAIVKDLSYGASYLASEVTGCKALILDDSEQTRLVESSTPLLRKWFPNLGQGEMSPELAFVIGVGTIGVTKYFVYRAWQAEEAERAKKKLEEEKEKNSASIPAPSPFS